MLTLVKRSTTALLIVATLGSSTQGAWAKSDIDFGQDAAHDAGVAVIALTAVGVAAVVGVIGWLVVSNWPKEESETEAAEVADLPVGEAPITAAALAGSTTETAADLVADEPGRRAKRVSRRVTIAAR